MTLKETLNTKCKRGKGALIGITIFRILVFILLISYRYSGVNRLNKEDRDIMWL